MASFDVDSTKEKPRQNSLVMITIWSDLSSNHS